MIPAVTLTNPNFLPHVAGEGIQGVAPPAPPLFQVDQLEAVWDQPFGWQFDGQLPLVKSLPQGLKNHRFYAYLAGATNSGSWFLKLDVRIYQPNGTIAYTFPLNLNLGITSGGATINFWANASSGADNILTTLGYSAACDTNPLHVLSPLYVSGVFDRVEIAFSPQNTFPVSGTNSMHLLFICFSSL